MESAYSASAASPTNGLASAHANGYSQAGSDHGDHPQDESDDDDDSNPLEDLEALEEKEQQEVDAAAERVKESAEELRQVREREDEEGLSHARELARQGREESLRHHQAAQPSEGGATTDTNPPPQHNGNLDDQHTASGAPSQHNGHLDEKPAMQTKPAPNGLPDVIPSSAMPTMMPQQPTPVVSQDDKPGDTKMSTAGSDSAKLANPSQVINNTAEHTIPLSAPYSGFRAVNNEWAAAAAQGVDRI